MTDKKTQSWSDEKLQQFYDQFQDHLLDERGIHVQQQALHAAVFQQEDKDTNTPPGLLQMMGRMSDQLLEMRIWQDRQKTFVGGVVFTVSALWFFMSDVGPKLLAGLKAMLR